MTPHTSPHATHEEPAVKETKITTAHPELPLVLLALEKIANKKYSPYLDIAARFDDAQEVFIGNLFKSQKY